MRRSSTSSSLFGAGLVASFVVACGGGVSLGSTGSPVDEQRPPEEGGSPTTDGGTPGECSKERCGPTSGAPAEPCWDGSIGGNTGRCVDKGGGVCGWELRTCPPAPACFDANGKITPDYKRCNTASDCAVLTYQQNCCGTMHAEGVAKTTLAQIRACTDKRTAGFPGCGCPATPTFADDGTTDTSFSGVQPSVACNANRCETSFAKDACAGVTLPPCPRECTTFPETGSCTPGDECRLAGSKIGDECSCGAGGTWTCSPHPPLGTGCNLVCQ